jgi:hypothetical protein
MKMWISWKYDREWWIGKDLEGDGQALFKKLFQRLVREAGELNGETYVRIDSKSSAFQLAHETNSFPIQ